MKTHPLIVLAQPRVREGRGRRPQQVADLLGRRTRIVERAVVEEVRRPGEHSLGMGDEEDRTPVVGREDRHRGPNR